MPDCWWLLRFFKEINDFVLGVRLHDAKAVRFFNGHGHDGDGQISVLALVEVQHGAVVHLIDVVAGEDQGGVGIVFGEEVEILQNGVGGAGIPVVLAAALIRLQEPDAAVLAVEIPGFTDADVFVEAVGTILGEDADGIDAAIDTVADREVDNTELASKGNSGFGPFFGQDGEARAFSASQNHCNGSHWRFPMRLLRGEANL